VITMAVVCSFTVMGVLQKKINLCFTFRLKVIHFNSEICHF